MNRVLITVALTLAPAFALGSGHADIHIALPASPTMAVVRPGVQVVVGQDDEVFHTDHHYWLRRDGDWYHARHHGDAFVYVESHHVPSELLNLPPGQYRHYHPGAGYAGDGGDDDDYGHHDYGGCAGHGGGHGHTH